MEVKGKIKYQSLGVGTWTIVTDTGVTYELYQAPVELQKKDLSVVIEGTIKKDIMTIAMVGDVLAIDSFEILNS